MSMKPISFTLLILFLIISCKKENNSIQSVPVGKELLIDHIWHFQGRSAEDTSGKGSLTVFKYDINNRISSVCINCNYAQYAETWAFRYDGDTVFISPNIYDTINHGTFTLTLNKDGYVISDNSTQQKFSYTNGYMTSLLGGPISYKNGNSTEWQSSLPDGHGGEYSYIEKYEYSSQINYLNRYCFQAGSTEWAYFTGKPCKNLLEKETQFVNGEVLCTIYYTYILDEKGRIYERLSEEHYANNQYFNTNNQTYFTWLYFTYLK